MNRYQEKELNYLIGQYRLTALKNSSRFVRKFCWKKADELEGKINGRSKISS